MIPQLIAHDQGVLLLFTSRRQMESVLDEIEGALAHRFGSGQVE